MPIQLYGYANGSDADRPLRLSEVTVSASPDELRRAAEFLVHAAGLMEQRGDEFGHEHFGDFDPAVSADADLIVVGLRRDRPG